MIFYFGCVPTLAEGYAPTLGNKSSYTVTEITNTTQNHIPANTITVYDFNQETREIIPEYYAINLSKLNYGDTDDYNSINYYKFNKDNVGNFVLNNGTSDNYSIKYYVNSEKNGNRMTSFKTSENITKDFFQQSYINSGIAFGGAINNDNKAKLGNITGDFINNYVQGGTVRGGAIYTYNRTVGNVIGDFIGNHINCIGSQWTYGGAIMSYAGRFGDIVGNYINNYTYAKLGGSGGGALFFGYSSKAGNISGDFIGNYAYAGQGTSRGGAIQNFASTIGNITGDFIGNYVHAPNNTAIGGAISSYSSSHTENDVRLPEMSIKPYVEYGMGIQKYFKNDSLTAFGQAMVRNGGRNGVSLTAGFRFKVGKDLAKSNEVKVEKIKKTEKIKKNNIKKEKKVSFPKFKFFEWSLSANN